MPSLRIKPRQPEYSSQRDQRWFRRLVGGTILVSLSLGIIPLRLAIAIHQAPRPEAILVLGGGYQREETAAQLAAHYPDLPIWVSSGKLPQDAKGVFQTAGISVQRVYLDYQATDTVTNFTTLVDQFKQHRIQHLFLVTSNAHMPRAQTIATIVLGSQGIVFTPVIVKTQEPEESQLRTARDVGRSFLWIATGKTGASLGARVWPEALSRYPDL